MFKSQWNQDNIIFENFFKDNKGGVFIDIGASDGIEISNTYFFESHMDWVGLCLEPHDGYYKSLVKNRNCKCLNVCASDEDTTVKFNEINGYCSMVSGIEENYSHIMRDRINQEIGEYGGSQNIVDKPSFKLSTLMNNYGIQHVDYLSVDTQGSELRVLKGTELDEIDVISVAVTSETEEGIVEFLKSNKFEIKFKTGGDIIFRK
jgi:FkbM family methyltransferase